MRSPLLASAAALVVLAATALTGCASFDTGAPVTEKRSVTDVTAVELATDGDLTISVGVTPSLTVTAGERIIDRLTADVDAGVLRLGMAGEPPLRNGEIRYQLIVTSLDSLAVLGSGDASVDFAGADAPSITVHGSGDVDAIGMDAAEAHLTITGSGEIAVHAADIGSLSVSVDGPGDVSIDGTASTQEVTLHGDADYAASGLRSDDATVTIRGAADASVTADDTLDAVIDGSGSIAHRGAATVTQEVSGSGEVVRAE